MGKLTKITTYNNKKEVGIYVHVPFCSSKCFYCNFNSYVIDNNKTKSVHENYVQALIKEIESYKDKLTNYLVTTIFIGGGTPSLLTKEQISKIIYAIKNNFNVSQFCEISIEINPTSAKFGKWLTNDVNRVSVGLQTANDKIATLIGRKHNLQDYLSTMQTLKNANIKNINTDIMIGLPSQTLKDIKQTLKVIIKQKVKHISAYALILEEDTPLNLLISKNKLTLPSEEENVKMYDLVYKTLKRHGYVRYEVSNFCKKGYECKHNLNTWLMKEYVGFGAGAHSFFNGYRFSNVKGINEYIEKINNFENAINEKEEISKQQLFEETVMLGLRLKQGINLNQIKNKFNFDLLKEKQKEIKQFKKLRLIKIKNNYLFLTQKGFHVLNKIVLELVY